MCIILCLFLQFSVQDSQPPPSSCMGLSEPEKEIKKLRKKLDQIAKLRERAATGEKLEINQVTRMKIQWMLSGTSTITCHSNMTRMCPSF